VGGLRGAIALSLLAGIAGGAAVVLGMATLTIRQLLGPEARVVASPVALTGSDVATGLVQSRIPGWLGHRAIHFGRKAL
jgi:hypothetical protein